MKKNLVLKWLCLAVVLLGFNHSVIAECPQTFPTSIDLNRYYETADSLTGNELKTALNKIIKGHTNLGYRCAWQVLKFTDEDPKKTDNVIGFYTRRSIPKTHRDYGKNTPDAWNREHIWPKSHGIKTKELAAYSDLHHLRATDKSVNADRASKAFANGGTQHQECLACRFTPNSWEPPNEVKGDTARIMFYMATRYEGNNGEPDLKLVDQTNTRGNQFGDLCDLLSWHLADPVSSEELSRNHQVYRFQGNRNPFIDRPEFAGRIWGAKCSASVAATESKDTLLSPWRVLALIVLLVSVVTLLKRNKRSN